jgi:hypothetical protein
MLQVLDNDPAAIDTVADDNGARITDGFFGTTPRFPSLGRPNNPTDGPNQ